LWAGDAHIVARDHFGESLITNAPYDVYEEGAV
jgi:hypothetical protein